MNREGLNVEFDYRVIDRYIDDLADTVAGEFLTDMKGGLEAGHIADVRDFLYQEYNFHIEDKEKADLFQYALQTVRNEVNRVFILDSLAQIARSERRLPNDLVTFIQKFHSELTPQEAVELRTDLRRAQSAGFFGKKKIFGVDESKILPLYNALDQSLASYCEWTYDYPKAEQGGVVNDAFKLWASDNPKQIREHPVKTIQDILRSVTLEGVKVKSEAEAYAKIDDMLERIDDEEQRQAMKSYILACAGQVISNDLYILQTLGSHDHGVSPTLSYDGVAAMPLGQSGYKHDISIDPKTGEVLVTVELNMSRINLLDGRMFVLDENSRQLVDYEDAQLNDVKTADTIFRFNLTTKLTMQGNEVVPSIAKMAMHSNTVDLQHEAVRKFMPTMFQEQKASLEATK